MPEKPRPYMEGPTIWDKIDNIESVETESFSVGTNAFGAEIVGHETSAGDLHVSTINKKQKEFAKKSKQEKQSILEKALKLVLSGFKKRSDKTIKTGKELDAEIKKMYPETKLAQVNAMVNNDEDTAQALAAFGKAVFETDSCVSASPGLVEYSKNTNLQQRHLDRKKAQVNLKAVSAKASAVIEASDEPNIESATPALVVNDVLAAEAELNKIEAALVDPQDIQKLEKAAEKYDPRQDNNYLKIKKMFEEFETEERKIKFIEAAKSTLKESTLEQNNYLDSLKLFVDDFEIEPTVVRKVEKITVAEPKDEELISPSERKVETEQINEELIKDLDRGISSIKELLENESLSSDVKRGLQEDYVKLVSTRQQYIEKLKKEPDSVVESAPDVVDKEIGVLAEEKTPVVETVLEKDIVEENEIPSEPTAEAQVETEPVKADEKSTETSEEIKPVSVKITKALLAKYESPEQARAQLKDIEDRMREIDNIKDPQKRKDAEAGWNKLRREQKSVLAEIEPLMPALKIKKQLKEIEDKLSEIDNIKNVDERRKAEAVYETLDKQRRPLLEELNKLMKPAEAEENVPETLNLDNLTYLEQSMKTIAEALKDPKISPEDKIDLQKDYEKMLKSKNDLLEKLGILEFTPEMIVKDEAEAAPEEVEEEEHESTPDMTVEDKEEEKEKNKTVTTIQGSEEYIYKPKSRSKEQRKSDERKLKRALNKLKRAEDKAKEQSEDLPKNEQEYGYNIVRDELAKKDEVNETEQADAAQVELSDETEKAEHVPLSRERESVIKWAAEIGGDEDWVDSTFTFHDDGSISVEGSLNLSGTGSSTLPAGLKEIKGNLWLDDNQIESLKDLTQKIGGTLDISDNKIKSFEGLSQKIEGSLDISNNQIKSLKGSPQEIGGSLNISFNEIKSLKDLKGKTIGGDLIAENIPATSIPKGINIKGQIQLHESQVKLIKDAKAKGYDVAIIKEEEG